MYLQKFLNGWIHFNNNAINDYLFNTLHSGKLLNFQDNAWVTTVPFQNRIAGKF